MQGRTVIVTIAAVIFSSALPAMAANHKPLELFGVKLNGATRDQLRQAFKQHNLVPTREDNRYWFDTYAVNGVLDGASQFEAGYVSATNRFAIAEYTFSGSGFMDTQMVKKVIEMVREKYGQPSSLNGDYNLGPVTAQWNMGQDMLITVTRGWPDTTTYLDYEDTANYRQLKAEMAAEKKAEEHQQVKNQGNAF